MRITAASRLPGGRANAPASRAAIVEALEREGGRMSVLLNGVIDSVPFQTLRRVSPQLPSVAPVTAPRPVPVP